MGRDKALLELGGRTLLERSIATLEALVPRVLLACGESARYGELSRELVLDRHPAVGPLAGLAAALERAQTGGQSWLLALACDLPHASSTVFARLLARAREREADACLLSSVEGLEPLCAVYRIGVLPAVLRSIEQGERRMVAFHSELCIAELARAELPAELADCARNVNRPEEFLAAGGGQP